jgi:hypothetical protein
VSNVDEQDMLSDLLCRLRQDRPVPWDSLPDISLYMDQLISYLPRQLIRFDDGEKLTSSMVNNYSKQGLLPRADGKRYGRNHLALLTAICALKQVISVREVKSLLPADLKDGGEGLYGRFCAVLDAALTQTADKIEDSECGLRLLALELALGSYAHKLACQRILDILQEDMPRPDKGREK